MTIKNDPFFGWIEITLSSADFTLTPEGATYDAMQIKRTGGRGSWGTTVEATVEATVGFTSLTIRDVYPVSGYTYTYKFKLVNGTAAAPASLELTADPIMCSYDGLWIGNESYQYRAIMNIKVTPQREYAVNYVMPYYSQFPHVIQSGSLNYVKGSAEGLFLQTENDDGCTFTLQDAIHYKDGLATFLTNGEPKVLKTWDGRAWYVMIDSPVNMASDDFVGDGLVSFNWTQIATHPYSQNPASGIIKIEEVVPE